MWSSTHSCKHCGAEVNAIGRHALSCRKSEGRHYCHTAVNDIIHRTRVAAHVPSWLEPPGLLRKRPDGVTVVPWKCGKLLVWDPTCPDTLAPSYSSHPHKLLVRLLHWQRGEEVYKAQQPASHSLVYSSAHRNIRSNRSKVTGVFEGIG